MVNISNHSNIRRLAFVLLTVSAVVYYADTGGDYDVWFHLKYGEHFVRNLTWNIDHSMFSWTPADPDWKYVTWIGSSIFYIVYRIASAIGLSVLQWLVFLGIFSLFAIYARSIKDTFDVSSITGVMLVAIALNPSANIIKPELFTVLFFAAAVFIYFYSKSSQKNLFFLYPVLFMFWVNTHGGFIFGLFFISLALCLEAFGYLFIKKGAMTKALLIRLALSVISSYVATLLNPYGISYHIGLFRYLTSAEFMQGNVQVFAYFNMWSFLFPKEYIFRFINAAWSMVLMFIVFLAVSIYAYRRIGSYEIQVLALNIIFSLIGMRVGRASAFFPLIWFPSVLYIFRKADLSGIRGKLAPFALAIMLISAGSVFYNTLCCMEYRSWFGAKSMEFVPAKEVEFIKGNRLIGPIFNDYLTGSYMIWSMYPDYKVFIDSRYGPYIKQIVPDYLYFRNNLTPQMLESFTSKYQFKTVLLHFNEMPLIALFLSSPDWRLVYFDRVAAVLVHRSIEGSISPHALSRDLGPSRFRDVRNPITLADVFDIYRNIPMDYRIKLPLMREVLEIFRRNVSDFYIGKRQIIENMEQVIFEIETELLRSRQQ